MKTILTNYFKASFPAIAINTSDDARTAGDVIAAAKEAGKRIMTWSATVGLVDVQGNGRPIGDTEDPQAAFKSASGKKAHVVIFNDLHTFPFERDPILLRAFKDFVMQGPENGSSVVLLGNEFQPHPTMDKLFVCMDYELPTTEELAKVAEAMADSNKDEMEPEKCGPIEKVVRALSGLTIAEAENALGLSIIEKKCFCPKVIYREKVKAVKKSGLLDVIEADPRGLEAIGGLENLKEWIGRRRRLWSPEAAAKKLKSPKGMLVVGVPGTGKSLCAKVIGTVLEMPTLRLDIGSMFNSLVGESERRIRETLKLAEALSPCILWIDEIDRGLAGTGGSGSGDSGVGKRVLGTIITWMQERKKPVFVFATANDVSAMDSALLRKGRFDEIFSVDLPTADERRAIFKLHLNGSQGIVAGHDVIDATDGFTGSEIEAVVDEAMIAAFDADRDMIAGDLISAARATVPLSVTAKEQVEGIRRWAQGRARPAAGQPKPQEAPATRRIGSGKN